MALVCAVMLTAGFAPFVAIPLYCVIFGLPIELSSIGFTLSVDSIIWWWVNVAPHCIPGCLASFALFLSVFLLMQLSASSKERAADGGVLGEARVKSGSETIQGSEIWDGHGQPKSRGFVYGFEKTLFGSRYLFEPRRHMFLDGSTGAGKSRALLIPTIDLLTYGADDGESNPQTIIVSDVKSELIELTGDELERRGYRVLLLDAQHPERSNTFNPLELAIDSRTGEICRGRNRPRTPSPVRSSPGKTMRRRTTGRNPRGRCSRRRSFWSCWTRAAHGAASTLRRSITSYAWGRRGPVKTHASR